MNYELNEERLQILRENVTPRGEEFLNEWFPKKAGVGDWVIDPVNPSMLFIKAIDRDMITWFGFDYNNKWVGIVTEKATLSDESYIVASPEYVLQRLSEYADSLGYDHGNPNYKTAFGEYTNKGSKIGYETDEDGDFWINLTDFGLNCLMKDGKWAEIKKAELTVEQRFEKAEKEIVELKKQLEK